MPLPFARTAPAVARPTFSRDFAGLKTLDHGVGPAITFTRGSDATYFNAAGTLTMATTNEPRFDHNPSSGASLGLLIEEARTNSIRNSQAGGSTNGVIGSGGALPTNWSATANANSVTTEIIGTGTEDGLAYIDVKISGTPSASSSVTIAFESFTQIVASNTQTWTGSVYAKLQSGAVTNTTIRVSASGRDSGGNAVASQTVNTNFTPTSSALKTQRFAATVTMSDASVVRVLSFVNVVYTSGNPIDLTLRIAAPQLEQGAFPTSYIPTTNAAATRAADSAVVTLISSFYNQSEGTLFAEYRGAEPSAGRGIVEANVNAITDRIAITTASSTAIPNGSVRVTDSNQAVIVVGSAPLSSDIIKFAFAASSNDFQAARGGTLGTADTSGLMTPSLTHLRIGATGSGSSIINGHIRKIAYWPKRLTNTLLQQLTT